MCRMVGVVFRDAFPCDVLSDLRHVSEVGKVPDQGDEEDGHRDGWGMVSFRWGSPFYLGRSARPIHVDPSFDEASKRIPTLDRPNILLCHARRGTEGAKNLQNTHPFVADGLVFGHNGSVKDFHPATRHHPAGDSDSSRLFALFLDRYGEERDVKRALKCVLEEDIPGHEFTGLILLLSDGKNLYGYRDFGPGRDADYYNLRLVKCVDHIVLFQESGASQLETVQQIDRGELVKVDLDLEVTRERLL